MSTRRRTPPVVSHQEVRWVPESRLVQLSDHPTQPYRVWTLYDCGTDPNQPPSLPITPVHNRGAFLEDRIHDWMILKGNLLKYYSRVVEHSTWILIEYVSEGEPK
jgi:hypothetical protein